jgi:hypothetical protein
MIFLEETFLEKKFAYNTHIKRNLKRNGQRVYISNVISKGFLPIEADVHPGTNIINIISKYEVAWVAGIVKDTNNYKRVKASGTSEEACRCRLYFWEERGRRPS